MIAGLSDMEVSYLIVILPYSIGSFDLALQHQAPSLVVYRFNSTRARKLLGCETVESPYLYQKGEKT
jgi:hypothetical protein